MHHTKATTIANQLVLQFAPYCQQDKVKIAGSLRRGEHNVGDIKIVTMPILAVDLFGQIVPLQHCAFDAVLQRMTQAGTLGTLIKGGPRYKQFALPQGINLDLFLVRPPAEWGVILALRTGPDNFSRWLVTQRAYGGALPPNYHVRKGALHWHSRLIPTPQEVDFLDTLGLGWIEPAKRQRPPPNPSN